MSADPAQITAARIQAIIDDWLDLLAGSYGPITPVGRFQDILALEGTWALDDSGLWLEAGAISFTPVAAMPVTIQSKAGSTGARVIGHAALLYCASISAQPTADIQICASTGNSTGSGTSTPTPAEIGWHLVTWAGTPINVGANECIVQRFTLASQGDRVAAGVVVVEAPP